jgi:ribosome-associated protein
MNFELKADQEFIQLNNLLQVLQFAQTGGHSKILIKNQEVKVNGEIELQIRKKIRKGDIVEVGDKKVQIN